jgi:DNA-binding response OmpR family regulator
VQSIKPKILLIEDDRELVESILLIFNYHWPEAQVIFSYSGEHGIELTQTEDPSAIILDLGLPDMSGFEVLKKIRLFSNIPIIVLTARSSEDDVVKALEQEATDYIIKPFRHRELLARIQSHISRWQLGEIRAMTQYTPQEKR